MDRRLGAVETIHEEDGEDSPPLSSTPSSPLSPASSPFLSMVEKWSARSGQKPDVVIKVQGMCFHLHKDRLTTRSNYLKRRLTEGASDLTLSPPLNLSVDTFHLVAEFCYGFSISVTPFNVASLATAAVILEMTPGDGCDGGDDLRLRTETSFRQYVSVNVEYIPILFRSCLDLLPEAEKEALLVSRCLEAWGGVVDGDGAVSDSLCTWLEDVVRVKIGDFSSMVESLHHRLTSHDVLYKIIDLYLKEWGGKLSEQQMAQLCDAVDCTRLSPGQLVHAVQNPRVPLRFVIRAMLVEHLHTRHSVASAYDRLPTRPNPRDRGRPLKVPTLGSILRRDAAERQAAQLKSAMEATNSRIEGLEKEIDEMKERLLGNKEDGSAKLEGPVDGSRSMSFHFGQATAAEKAVGRGGKGSVSLRTESEGSTLMEKESTRRNNHGFGRRLVQGLKNVFGVGNEKSIKGGRHLK
ncbi:hypothetical protein MLD38_005054 [Melastoma candidum]|uniref:Uncharacterized protein n=1 Tax=Melastoma candidum TaxID=119954 RepID=A0ACB9S7N1_9MYRT|nr:hypothetical protein MLD38_005054 [Melastoma candidum]